MNNKSSVILQTKINYEYFAEVNKPLDPMQIIYKNSNSLQESITKLAELLNKLKKQYPEYSDFYYSFNHTQPSHECYEAWFNLHGIRK